VRIAAYLLVIMMVGLGGLEPPTSPLSGARSSHLSYRPQPRGELLTTMSFYGVLACLATVHRSLLCLQDSNFSRSPPPEPITQK
jgi:hypothetical protein